jgi:hypothetical protein
VRFEKAKIDEKPINKERGELTHEKILPAFRETVLLMKELKAM